MRDPAEFGVRFVEELAGFEAFDFEAGIVQQELDLHWRVFAVVPGLGFLACLAGPDVGREKRRMVALQDAGDGTQRRDVGGSENQMAAGLQDAVDLMHHVHGVGRQVLEEFAAKHSVK